VRRGTGTFAALGLLIAGATFAVGDEPAKTTRDFRAFKPSVHGFAFVNHFEGSPLPISLGGLEQSVGAPDTYGLCGGMSFAAADYFVAGRAMPGRGRAPVRGEALYDYIYKRQTASLGEGMTLAARFGRWMSTPDEGFLGTRAMTAGELDGIVGRLERGEPVVLGLVLDRHAGNTAGKGPVGPPWQNHQVLAYAVSQIPSGTIDLWVYDPNYPKEDRVAIRCHPVIADVVTAGPWGGVQTPVIGAQCERIVPGKRLTLVRGIFAMEYAPATPPEGLD